MAQAKITKEDVRRVRDQLKAEGTKPTLDKIRAALGNIGSVTTIQGFKTELDEEEQAEKDSPEALQTFRDVWSMAVHEGRSQREVEVQDLKETIQALSDEVNRSDAEASASQLQAEGAVKKLEETVGTLNGTIDDLCKAREASERYAAKLVEVGEEHAQEVSKLRDQVEVTRADHNRELHQLREQTEKENEQHHEECKGLRQQLTVIGTEHRLEIERLHSQAEKASEQHREEIKELRGQMGNANQQYREEVKELRARLDSEMERANDLRVKLACAEALTERRGDDLTSEEPAESPGPNGRHGSATP
jgi:chromosome segregation ATPase